MLNLYEILNFTDGQVTPGLGWHDKIVEGFPQASLWSLSRALDVEPTDTAGLVGFPMELIAWKKRGTLMSTSVSDKLYQIARAFQRLLVPLKDEAAARTWLRSPQPTLNGRIPILLLMTQPGTAEVLSAIEAIKPIKTVEMNVVYEDLDDVPDESAPRKAGDDDNGLPSTGLDEYPED